MNPLKYSAPWVLPKGCAATCCPARAGVLRAVGGRAWVTFDLASASRVTDAGDHFVAVGRDLAVRAGQRMVIEAWPDAGHDGVRLVWEPLGRSPAITHFLLRLKRRLDRLLLGRPSRPVKHGGLVNGRGGS